MKAARLFEEQLSQAEVARRLSVSREAVRRWYDVWQKQGSAGLKGAGRAGRKPRLTREELSKVESVLLEGARAFGFSTELWTLPRVAGAIERVTGVRYHPGHVWRILVQMRWSPQRPIRRASERNDEGIRQWRRAEWPRIKKSSAPSSLDRLRRRNGDLRASAGHANLVANRSDAGHHTAWRSTRETVDRGCSSLSMGRQSSRTRLPSSRGRL